MAATPGSFPCSETRDDSNRSNWNARERLIQRSPCVQKIDEEVSFMKMSSFQIRNAI